MVIAIRAILIALLVLRRVLSKRLLALLAQECHLRRLRKRVRVRLGVALCAVEPLFAAGCTYRHLRVQDVFTA